MPPRLQGTKHGISELRSFIYSSLSSFLHTDRDFDFDLDFSLNRLFFQLRTSPKVIDAGATTVAINTVAWAEPKLTNHAHTRSSTTHHEA